MIFKKCLDAVVLTLALGLSACAISPKNEEPRFSNLEIAPYEISAEERILAEKTEKVINNVLIDSNAGVSINEDSVEIAVQIPCEDGGCTVYVKKGDAQKVLCMIFYEYDSKGIPKNFTFLADNDGDGIVDKGIFGVYYSDYLNVHGVPEIKKTTVFDYLKEEGLWSEAKFQKDFECALDELLWYYNS